MFIDQRITVAELTGQFRFHRNPGQLFKRISSGASRVISRSAGSDHDLSYTCQFRSGYIDLFKIDPAFPDPGRRRRLYGSRLFHDLLQHEMIKTAFFRRLHIPVDPAALLFDRSCGAVKDHDGI